jgi:hypothetical protein
MLPYLREFGWEPLILKCDPDEQEGIKDADLLKSVPSNIQTWTASAVPRSVTQIFGLGNVGVRSLPSLWRVGLEIIHEKTPDVVFFSTTMFPVTVLGPIWKRASGIPYIVDFQDPWVDDYYTRSNKPPPGGKWKHGFHTWLAGFLEPWVIKHVAYVVCVSPGYVTNLRRRYSYLRTNQFTVLPFGAPERDFELLPSLEVRQRLFDPADGYRHFICAGRGGKDMERPLELLFQALQVARARSPHLWNNVRFHFIGTSYAPKGKGRNTVAPIAETYAVGDLVNERTDRVEYFEVLQTLKEASALLVIGSDSSAYTPSKLYPYILAQRPMLAILHEQSPASEIVRRCRAGTLVTFGDADAQGAGQIDACVRGLETVIDQVENRSPPEVDKEQFCSYSAREMTRKLCRVFDETARKTEARSTATGIMN